MHEAEARKQMAAQLREPGGQDKVLDSGPAVIQLHSLLLESPSTRCISQLDQSPGPRPVRKVAQQESHLLASCPRREGKRVGEW
jgi:hypothetical protein